SADMLVDSPRSIMVRVKDRICSFWIPSCPAASATPAISVAAAGISLAMSRIPRSKAANSSSVASTVFLHCVILEAFYPLVLTVSREVGVHFHPRPNPLGCRTLVGGLLLPSDAHRLRSTVRSGVLRYHGISMPINGIKRESAYTLSRNSGYSLSRNSKYCSFVCPPYP